MDKKKVQYVLDDETARIVKILAARQRLTQSELITKLVDLAWVEEAQAVINEAKKAATHGQ